MPVAAPERYSDRDVTLGCFVFALPDPLPFPDGTTIAAPVGDQPHSELLPDDPLVTLTFHQVTSSVGRTRGSYEAIAEVVSRLPHLLRSTTLPELHEAEAPREFPGFPYSVVVAVTQMASPDSHGQDCAESPADLRPRQDAFNRCLRLVGDLARAYRIASGVQYGMPSYERLGAFVQFYTASARRVPMSPAGTAGQADFFRVEGPFNGPSVMLLDHLNTPDIVAGPVIEGETKEKFNHWMRLLRIGSPMFTWRERLIEADRALNIHGEYAQGVVLAQTAAEVFLDTLLTLMLWEEGADAEQAALLFDDGRLARRIKSEWGPRLGGNWALDGDGPVANWFQKTAQLRNRVVHGGYQPTRAEALAAFKAVYPLETFAYNRLAQRRAKYPRSVLLTIGDQGLRRRGLWSGTIKTFAEKQGPAEANWEVAFKGFRDKLVRARAVL